MKSIIWLSAVMLACTTSSSDADGDSAANSAGANAAAATNGSSAATDSAFMRLTIEAEPQDSVIFEERMALARSQRMDTLPIGEIVVRMGQSFVGMPYVPGTLEAPGPERLIVNLRTFDCVTFVESSMALARTIRSGGGYRDFQKELARIRYRGGITDGYTSRLHYFSDWIADNDRKGIVSNITGELGGIADPQPITFMTSHIASYRQLSDTAVVRVIAETERRLTAEGRVMVPEAAIAAVASRIKNGDVIAAATTVEGLDVAHTGLALWVGNELRLMHAPLVGTTVQISENSLAERIVSSKSQDGIMVARPR